MAKDNTQFLRFSAYSIKDLITRKLSEDTKMTDQIYEGSNLAVLIDLVSYMFQCLMYALNNAASESMFSDVQIYENIRRLVDMIGYTPGGCKPTSIAAYINNLDKLSGSSYQIFPFSCINTGLTDSNGNIIYFSTVKCGEQTSGFTSQEIVLYNGIWKLYPTVFTASGIDYEKFTLDGIKSDSDAEQYVAGKFFKIYVQSQNSDGESNSLDSWQLDNNNIFAGFGLDVNESNPAFSKLYSSSSKVFQVLPNKEKTYEVRFGNGFTGKKLNPGDKVYIFYLKTNGPGGDIDFQSINQSQLAFKHSNDMFGMSRQLYDEIFSYTAGTGLHETTGYTIALQPTFLSQFKKEESVEDIRQNAPNWFKTGNRLITREDYEYFIKNEYPKVVDIKCMNNWEILAKFYKWLFDIGENPNNDLTESGHRETPLNGGHTYLNKYMLESRNYKYVDAADANNIYLWTELTDNLQIKTFDSELIQNLQYIKMLTSEIYAMSPIHVNFRLCAAPVDVELDRIYGSDSNNTYLEITLDDNCIYVASTVQIMVVNIITDYFSKQNCKIGQLVDNNSILNQIYQINGVKNVRTIYNPDNEISQYRVYQGLSFSSYSADLIDRGEDLEIGSMSRKLQDFQFPHFEMSKSELLMSVKVIKKQLSNASPIKF